MTKKTAGRTSERPSKGDVEIRFVEAPPASKKDGPVRRETIEVDMSWLEKDEPAPIRVTEPVLRREVIVRREPAAAKSAGRKSNPKMAAASVGAMRKDPPAKVSVRKIVPAKKDAAHRAPEPSEPANDGAFARASAKEPPPLSAPPSVPPLQTGAARSTKRLAPPLPREDAPDSMPPPRRSSKPPRRRS